MKKDKTYYLINSLIMLFLLVLSPIYSNDIHLSTGDNLVSYPFDLIQSFEDGISKENLSNVWGISSNGKSKQKINGDWYGSLDLLEPNQEYWLSVDHSSNFHFNYPRQDIVIESVLSRSFSSPDSFNFNQSLYQGFYFIKSADILDSSLVVGEDWIGAFNGDVCIGARQWNGAYTDVPVMGYDPLELETEGYLNHGDYPRFVIYDASEGEYYDAFISQNYAFQQSMIQMYIIDSMSVEEDCNGNIGVMQGDPYLDDCDVCSGGDTNHEPNSDKDCLGVCFGNAYVDDCDTCDDDHLNDCRSLSIDLNEGANLISFSSLPINNSIDSIFASIIDDVKLVIAEGEGTINLNGNWYGSISEINPDQGYWVIMDDNISLTIDRAIPTHTIQTSLEYSLHEGNNLISYPFDSYQNIEDAIPLEYRDKIFAIASNAYAAKNINGSWSGSLNQFHASEAYWFIMEEDIQFEFNYPNIDFTQRVDREVDPNAPDLFSYSQSPYQAFYWISNADIDGEPLEVGVDWIGAFYGDECIGARVWSGLSTLGIPTDVPVMGYDDDIPSTENYITAGQFPRFVIYDVSDSSYYDANAYDNHVFEGALLAMYSINSLKVEVDCAGTLGGDHVLDNCGVCADPNDSPEGWPCPYDCEGVAGGEAFIDDCGICSGGNTGHVANSDQDNCGDCCLGGPDDLECWNANEDCNGDCYGTAFIDDCGICSGGYSGHFGNSDKDCNGDCFGDAFLDDCNICSEGLSGHASNSDKDCNGDCFGDAILDDCNVCSEGLSEHVFNDDQDCDGECFGEAIIQNYYLDVDGDGLGGNYGQEFCNTDVPEGWVLNDADIDDDCQSNYFDCMDMCDGDAIIQNYYLDVDGDGLGGDMMADYCSGDVPEGWVLNDNDEDDNCYSNYHDCAGICDGDEIIQGYWLDEDGDGLGGQNYQEYCTSDVPSGWVLNNNDEADDCYSNYQDCAGVCNGFAQINIYYLDFDGDGLGGDNGQEFCDIDVPAGWVLNSDDDDDDCQSNDYDCLGICDGSTMIDECNVCGGDNSTCADCSGMPNGDNVIDNCGVCDSDDDNDCMQDCSGEWGGNAIIEIYYEDIDGDGLGYGVGENYCSALVPDGWVLNNYDLEPECSTNDIDECGICGGNNSSCEDECGIPNGNNSSCLDECGIPNGTNVSCADCAGVPNGNNVLDNCGVCDDDPSNDCPFDCFGDPGGNAYLDDCGICSGGNSGHIPNSDLDQCGVCFGNGEDQQGCGCFNGPFLNYWYDYDNDELGSCTEIDGDCLPCSEDPSCELFCGWDVPEDNWADNSDDEDDYCNSNTYDCAGVCDGDAIIQNYYLDVDGDGLGGDGDSVSYCSALAPDGWVSNNDDEDDDCYSNYHDCAGVCDGDAIIQTYYEDIDGDGLGYGMGENYCSALVPDGWVLNNDDEDDDCQSNYFDCSGVCDGDAIIQTYYEDIDGDGLGYGDPIEICNYNIPPGFVLNGDDLDDDCYSNIIDECGVCDGDGTSCTGCTDDSAFNFGCQNGEIPPCESEVTIDDGSCIYYPDEFIFNQSQMQAFYIIEDAEIFNVSDNLELFEDWIGVFNGNQCVGSYPWLGDVTTIPSMGNDGTLLTAGYLENGDFPIFRIYDGSENKYLDTYVTIETLTGEEYQGWENFGFYFVNELIAFDKIMMSWEFMTRADLISYLGIPGDGSISVIMEPLGDYADGLIGEGSAALLDDDGEWLGSLREIDPNSGYWIILNVDEVMNEPIHYDIEAYPTNPNIEYNLHERLNLISYVGSDGMGLDEALPDDIEMNIISLSTAGKAAMRTSDGNWIGSLTEWNVLTGYWVNVYVDGNMQTFDTLTFSFINSGLARNKEKKLSGEWKHQIPFGFEYVQSTNQAFYFINDIIIDDININKDDWIIAYNNGIVVGARRWNEGNVDIPVMGYDGFEETINYCQNGDMPNFKLYKSMSDELIDLDGNFESWSNNLISHVGIVNDSYVMPQHFMLGEPYPNPFNPITTIAYEVPFESEIELVIYDIKGRVIETLISDYVEAGINEISWDASSMASGVYFVKLKTQFGIMTKKIVLMK